VASESVSESVLENVSENVLESVLPSVYTSAHGGILRVIVYVSHKLLCKSPPKQPVRLLRPCPVYAGRL
jgi:hypothetical protein